jgi:hypothetical protein
LTVQVIAQQLKTENIFIITLDGLRWQELYSGADSLLIDDSGYVEDPEALTERFWNKDPLKRREMLMPFFWGTIAKEGQLYGNRKFGNKVNCSNNMWFSYPGYNEILSGAPDDKNINSNDKIPNPNITVLEFFNNQPSLKDRVAAFGSWDVFPYIINEDRSGVPVNAGFDKAEGSDLTEKEILLNEMIEQIRSPWGSVRLDPFTHHYAVEYIKKNQPRVVYISYGETDDFAHDGRYEEYLKSAYMTDQLIKNLWEMVQSTEQYKGKTTFIITTDHGRGTVPKETWKHHGAKIKGADQIWIAVLGPDTEAKGEIKTDAQLYQKQVAKTVAAFMGLDFSTSENQGEVIKSMIK